MSHHNLRSRQVPRVTHNIGQGNGRGRRPPMEHHVFGKGNGPDATGNLIDLNAHNVANPTAPRVQTGPTGRLCDVFTGQDPLVLVEDWMALFEMATDFSTDVQRKALLSRHVSNEAMQWLVREIAPIRATLTWDQVKTRMVDRFKRSVHNHLEQAMDRMLKNGETIQAYFLEKRRLLDLAGQTQENQIALLTRGLPSKLMKAQVAASRPRTTADWLEIALAVENTLKSSDDTAKPDRKPRPARVNHVNDQGNSGTRGQFGSGSSQPNRSDSNQNPNTPCPVCRLFGQREFHWKRNCPRLRPVNESSGSANNNRSQRPPAATGSDSTQASTGANQAAPTNLVITRPELIHIDLTINNRHVFGLLDTGSTITAVSRTVAERLGLTWDTNRSIPLTHVDGEARTLGAITLPVGINGHFHRVTVHVLQRLASDCLIGVDLAHLARLDIQFGRPQSQSTFAVVPAVHMANTIINDHCSDQSPAVAMTTVTPAPKINNALSAAQRAALQQVLDQATIFARDENHIGKIVKFEHVIRLKPGAQPVAHTPFRFSPVREAQFRTHVNRLLAAGVIRKSTSPWCCRMFLVKKGPNETRPVVDFRPVNQWTVPEHTPLPVPRDLIDKTHDLKFFSHLDVKWSFMQVRLSPESIELTSFCVPWEQFEFLFVPFGVRNGSSVFQRALRDIIEPISQRGVIQFVDDLILHTKTIEDHIQLVREVLNLLADNGVVLRLEKCSFVMTEIQFLGHEVGFRFLRPTEAKTRAITEFPTPT